MGGSRRAPGSVNVSMMERALAYIKKHPDNWQQGDWRCETGMCFAGIVCQIAGGQWLNPKPQGDYNDAFLLARKSDGEDIEQVNGFNVVRAAARARRTLSLWNVTPEAQWAASSLFQGDNTLERLEYLVAAITRSVEDAEEKVSA